MRLKKFPSNLNLLRVFIKNRCWLSLSAFLISIYRSTWFLFLTYMLTYIDWFSNVKPTLHSGDKPHLVICLSFLTCCWIQFNNILYRIFVREIFWSIVLFSYEVFVFLILKVTLAPPVSWELFSSLWHFWKSLCRVGTISSWNVL